MKRRHLSVRRTTNFPSWEYEITRVVGGKMYTWTLYWDGMLIGDGKAGSAGEAKRNAISYIRQLVAAERRGDFKANGGH